MCDSVVQAVTVNLVIRDSDDMEHLQSVTNVGKLFTILFLLTEAKIIINCFYININNRIIIK